MMCKIKPMALFIAIVFLIAAVWALYLKDVKLVWFYILSAAINIVVGL